MVKAKLRILQTTDLHLHFLPHDYVGDRPAPQRGLLGLIPQIDAARADEIETLLFDNGDFLQGTPLDAELIKDGADHPMIAAFNALKYDAIGLGNHEFDFGLNALRDVIAGCEMPVLCANARTGPLDLLCEGWTILERKLRCDDGGDYPVRVGVIGFVTPRVTAWNAHLLGNTLRTDDVIAAARHMLPQMRRAGADLIVALCHGGIDTGPRHARMENPAYHLAAIADVDVVLAGHTHDRFPDPRFAGRPHVDAARGTLFGKPAMLPDALGAALGVMDLDLILDEDRWRIADHKTTLRLPVPEAVVPVAAQLRARIKPRHDRVVADLRTSLTQTPRRLTSYFAVLGHDDTAPIVSAAQEDAVRAALFDHPLGHLPILSTTSPFRAGGRNRPRNYTDIGPGPIKRQDVAGMVPFNNPVCAVLRRGWQLRQWLELTSAAFRTCSDEAGPLCDAGIPPYLIDTIHGLRYRFDLSRPARPIEEHGRPARTRDVTFDGEPLADDALFILVTTTYRARGSADLFGIADDDVIHTSRRGLTDIVTDYVSQDAGPRLVPPSPNWSLCAQPGCRATFFAPEAAEAVMPKLTGATLARSGDADADGLAPFVLHF